MAAKNSKNAKNFNQSNTIILHHRGEIERALTLAKIMMIDKNNLGPIKEVISKKELQHFDSG